MIYQMNDLRTEDHPKEKHEAEAQVNLFQKHSFLNQLTHNMTTDCSLITYWLQYKKNTSSEHVVYKDCLVLAFKTMFEYSMFWTCIFEQSVVILWIV